MLTVTRTSVAEADDLDRTEARRLAERFRAGEVGALEEVVRLHQLAVMRTVRRLLGWRGDVDDVVQEVFLAALRQRGRFRGESSLRTWLIAIAIRRCRTERRRWWKRWIGKRRRDDRVVDESAQRDDVAEAVRQAVKTLAAKEQEVVVLYYLEEMTGAEVARVLRIDENAVNVRLHRARKKLKEMLGHLEI